MSENCFIAEIATSEIITNVTNFCSECYNSINKDETIFYDMQNYRYLCQECKESLQNRLDEHCNPLEATKSSLFNL